MTARRWARLAGALTLLVTGVLAIAGNTNPATAGAAGLALAVLAAAAPTQPGTMRRRSATALSVGGRS